MPEGPDVGRGYDEGSRRPAGVELAQAGVESAEKARGDVDVVSGLRCGDADGRHGELMVPQGAVEGRSPLVTVEMDALVVARGARAH